MTSISAPNTCWNVPCILTQNHNEGVRDKFLLLTKDLYPDCPAANVNLCKQTIEIAEVGGNVTVSNNNFKANCDQDLAAAMGGAPVATLDEQKEASKADATPSPAKADAAPSPAKADATPSPAKATDGQSLRSTANEKLSTVVHTFRSMAGNTETAEPLDLSWWVLTLVAILGISVWASLISSVIYFLRRRSSRSVNPETRSVASAP